MTPKTLSGMLMNRSLSIRSTTSSRNYDDALERRTSINKKVSDSIGAQHSMASEKTTSKDNNAESNMSLKFDSMSINDSISFGGRKLSIAKPQVSIGIRWQGDGYLVKINRRVFTGGETLQLTFKLSSQNLPALSNGNNVPDPNSINETPQKFSKLAKIMSNIKKSKNAFVRKPPTRKSTLTIEDSLVYPLDQTQSTEQFPNQYDQNLWTLKVYIEETQTVRAPEDSGDVALVNEAYKVHVDSYVANQLSALDSPTESTAQSFSTAAAELSTYLNDDQETALPISNPANLVRTAKGSQKLLCLVHTESFEGEFESEQVVNVELPPIFGVEDFNTLVEAENSGKLPFETPNIADNENVSEFSNSRSQSRSPSVSSMSFRMSAGSPVSSFNSDSSSLRPSIVASSQIQPTELANTKSSSNKLSLLRSSQNVYTNRNEDLKKLKTDGNLNVFAMHPSCNHPAITISHEIVVVLSPAVSTENTRTAPVHVAVDTLAVPPNTHEAPHEHRPDHHHVFDAAKKIGRRMSMATIKNIFSHTSQINDNNNHADDTLPRRPPSPPDEFKTPAQNTLESTPPVLDFVGHRLDSRFSQTSLTPTISISDVDAADGNDSVSDVEAVVIELPDPKPRFSAKLPPIMSLRSGNAKSGLRKEWSSDGSISPSQTKVKKERHNGIAAADVTLSAPELSTAVIEEDLENDLQIIVLRHRVTVSALSLAKCRAIVIEKPHLAGDAMFGVPLGFIEDGTGFDIMSRRGSDAGYSVTSADSKVSWRNLE
ncbi:hypothetical protein HK100_002976 [Physocladia obscura]|uniref:Uncharacterized protein n=1 Tax=Physocladia obscura TaxID=109957 RepID=A0AAD5XJW7_9FUNG|nr:hypothetical protein HK100_002976 [Physocladia obscura]